MYGTVTESSFMIVEI